MAARGSSWAVPPRVLGLSAVAALVLVAPLVAGYLVGGIPAALGLGMGYLACVRAGSTLRPLHALGIAVAVAMAGAVAVALRGQPFAAACFVALCCLLVAPAHQVADSLLTGVPSAIAVLVSVPGHYEVGPTSGWILLGGLLVVVLAGRLAKPAGLPAGLPAARAYRHATVMAVLVGAAVYVVSLLGWPHGYWVPLTLTVVLSPFDDQTRTRAAQRILGTVVGVLLSLLLATLVPAPVALAALAVCLVLTLAYTVTGDYVRQVLFMTPTVVLLGSAGSPETIAVERAAYTVGGAVLAILAALALSWLDGRTAGSAVRA